MFKNINSKSPERMTTYSAGYDLVSAENIILKPKEVTLVKTGVFIDHKWIKKELGHMYDQFMLNYFLALNIRSSLSYKQGLMLANGTGIIDVDYADEIGVLIYNTSNDEIVIKKDTRIAQLIIQKHEGHKLLGSMFTNNNVRDGGFGSTK